MTSDPSGWRTVDPDAGSVDSVLPDSPRAGETLVFSVDASDADRGWAALTVAAAIRGWSGSVDRLFVMDLDLQGVGIEDVLDARRAEGVSDLLLFGASLSRVVQTLDDGAFHFVPAGTPVANPRALLSHARWDDVVRSFGEAGAVLVLYLPTDQPGATSLLSKADRIVRLGRPGGGEGQIPAEVLDRLTVSLAPPAPDLASVSPDGSRRMEEPGQETGEAPETGVDAGETGEVVDITDLAPDEAPVEVGAGASGPEIAAAGETAGEGSPAKGGAAPWPGPVVDIRELAPDQEVVNIGDLAPDEPMEASASVEASASMGRPGAVPEFADFAPDEPVVDIADLAPDEPVGVVRLPEDGVGIPQDELGVEGGDSEFPEEASPEAEADRGVPFGPEAGEVKETAVPPGGDDFEEDAFVAGLDAIDEAAEAGGQQGLPDFDLDELDSLSESKEESGDPGREAEDELEVGAEAGLAGDDMKQEPGHFEEEILEEEPFEEEPFEEEPSEEASSDAEGIEDEVFAASDEEGNALDFGGFSGELDLAEEEPDVDAEAASEGARDPDAGVDEVEAEEARADTDDDFGADLVTGPDFGHTSSEEEEIWGEGADDEEAGADEVASAGVAAGGRGGPAGDGGSPPPDTAGDSGEPDGDEGSGTVAPRGGVGGRRRDRAQGRPLRLLALLVLLATGAATAHWYDVIDVPGLDRALATLFGPARTGAAPSVETGGAQPTSPIQSRSLLVDTYRDAQAATEVALALRGRLPDRIFAVAPVQADGDVTYQLLAGPANTGEEALALRGTLSEVLTREDPSQWTPHETSLAFLIDEVEGLDAARARADAVTTDGVFADVLRVTYPDGSMAHRIYAGGYADAQEARALQGILSQAGIDATFTERRGEIPE